MPGCGMEKAATAIVLGLVILLAVHCQAKPEGTAEPVVIEQQPPERVSLTIVYDNNAYDPRLQTAWGFACWVQYGETRLLFDTGGNGAMLLSNLSTLGFDAQDTDVVVLSHIHGDHTGGMGMLLGTGVRPDVYVPRTFPTRYKDQLRELVTVHEVGDPEQILPGIYTTGKMGLNVPEQGLILKTRQGLVVITGCAHPGIVSMVRRAKDVGQDDIYLVLGGFHLGGASPATVRQICEAFREVGVQNVAPCHCTGERAMGIFATEFGDHYLTAGVGWGIGLSP